MVVDPNKRLASLEQQQSGIQQTLNASPTARLGEQMPTMGDISAQQRLLKTQAQIEKIKGDELQRRWYGEQGDEATQTGGDPGFVGKTLDVLSRPLRGIVGAVDYATGRSGASSLGEAVTENILHSKRTFGDVVRETGVPGPIAAPLGFVLDVAFDPVNWLTLGTSALVPRVAAGLVRGTVKGGIQTGLKAAAKGAESRMLESALTVRNVGKLISGRTAAPKAAEELGRVGSFMRGVEERSLKSADEYNALTGRDIVGDVSRAGIPVPGFESQYRLRLGDLIKEGASRIPFASQYLKYFDYDNAEWTRIARIRDSLLKIMGDDENMRTGVKAFIRSHEAGIPFDDAMQQAVSEAGVVERVAQAGAKASPEINWGASDEAGRLLEPYEIDKSLSGLVGSESTLKSAADAADILKDPDRFITSDHMENALRIASESAKSPISIDDLKDVIGRGELGETGVKWFDDLRKSTFGFKHQVRFGKHSKEINLTMGKAIDALQAYTSFFKRAKVGASPTAWTNAVIGNWVMAWMGGVNVLDPVFMNRVKGASKIVRGTRESDVLLADFFNSSEMLKTMDANQTLFAKTTGMSPRFLQAKYFLERMIRTGKEEGLVTKDTNIGELGKALGYAMDDISRAMGEVTHGQEGAQQALGAIGASIKKIPTQRPSQMVSAMLKEGKPISQADLPTGMLANEFFDSAMGNNAFKYIREQAEAGNPVYKLLDLSFRRASEAYEGVDQTAKMATTMYATMDGFTEKELRVIARNIDLNPQDLTKVKSDGIWRYKMDGAKALELANEIYLNYNAMPAAIKVLRSLPLLGSPFASFMYGMMLKTGKTLAYNPAVFNKVSFALNDFGGEKSPLEKGVLTDPRYAYLRKPGMFKIPGLATSPFFETNSLYLNVANMIPYYSFNMFNPSERHYSDLYPNATIQTIDRLPFLKDPIGSTIFDYLIQPMIINDAVGDRPMGSFGQPLYPIDSTPLEKAGYAARNLMDPVIPGFWSPIGGVTQGYLAPGATELMPSYRWRQLAYALQGKTSIGKPAKEEPVSRSIRSILGTFGIPVQTPLPLSYLPKDLDKKLKEAEQ